jgi:aryl carrier-like protein
VPTGILEYPKWFNGGGIIAERDGIIAERDGNMRDKRADEIMAILKEHIHDGVSVTTDLRTVGLDSLTIMMMLEKIKRIKGIKENEIKIDLFYNNDYVLENVENLVNKIIKL